MIDGNSKDEVAPDFGIITADGAYVQGKDEYVRLLFYRDSVFPRRISQDKYEFDGTANREILHEVRLPYKPAKVVGIYLTASATIHEDILRGDQTVEPEPSTASGQVDPSRFMQMIRNIVDIVAPMDAVGEDKVVELIEDFLKRSKPKIDEILTNHSRRVAAK